MRNPSDVDVQLHRHLQILFYNGRRIAALARELEAALGELENGPVPPAVVENICFYFQDRLRCAAHCVSSSVDALTIYFNEFFFAAEHPAQNAGPTGPGPAPSPN
jgi:hypothetical protein